MRPRPTALRTASRRSRSRAIALLLGAGALVLAACSGTAEESPEAVGELEELEDSDGALTEALGDEDDPTADLEDPNERVSDGMFAANGVLLPAPEGWSFDPFAFASGIALSTSPDGSSQLHAEAVDPADLDAELTFEEVVEANRDSVAETPDVDEEVDLPGARRALHLRYLGLTAPEDAPEGQPDDSSVVLLIAEREDGVLAVFSYAAASDEFDADLADTLLATAGFDPDSDPMGPEPVTP
ncbi:MAG: hypothetical protein ACLFV0_04555 [Nitriliruptoraceae bacterium]